MTSRNRLGPLRNCLNSAVVNAGSNIDFGVIVMFDDDLESYFALPDYPWLEKIYLPTRHYYVRAANSLTRKIMSLDPDYLVLIDDDTEFIQPNWVNQAIDFFDAKFPDGLGIVDFLGEKECCHILTTPAFVKSMGGALYDPAYTQFYHDTDLRNKIADTGKFAHYNLINYQPFFVHKRDFASGASMILKDIKFNDFQVFKARSAAFGWGLYEA